MNEQLALGLKLSEHTRLEDYVGEAAERLQKLTGLTVISGANGSGKSHLLEGLCHRSQDLGFQESIYLGLEPDMDAGIVEGLENLTLVCLDDVHQVVGQPAWDQALFHLINACRDQGTMLVLASGPSVTALKPSLADLASRLKGAYLLTTDLLNDDQKLEVIRVKSARRGFTMSDEVCRFILGRAPRDMHHLARLVADLDEATLRAQKRVTIPFVKQALGL